MENPWEYYTVYRWMQNLNLSPLQVQIYAYIYSYSRNDRQEFYAGIENVQDMAGCKSRNTVKTALKTLEDRGLIKCLGISEHQTKKWRAIIPQSVGGQNLTEGGSKFAPYIKEDNIVVKEDAPPQTESPLIIHTKKLLKEGEHNVPEWVDGLCVSARIKKPSIQRFKEIVIRFGKHCKGEELMDKQRSYSDYKLHLRNWLRLDSTRKTYKDWYL